MVQGLIEALRPHVDVDPAKRHGRPVITGTKVTLGQVFGEIASGSCSADVAKAHGMDPAALESVFCSLSRMFENLSALDPAAGIKRQLLELYERDIRKACLADTEKKGHGTRDIRAAAERKFLEALYYAGARLVTAREFGWDDIVEQMVAFATARHLEDFLPEG